MNDARLYVLIGRKLSGEATVEELAELEELLRQQPVQPYMLEMLQEIWAKKGRQPEGQLLDEKWERLSLRLDRAEQAALPRKRSLWPRIAVAAGILGLILTVGGYLLLRPGNAVQAGRMEQEDTVIIARYGEKRKIVLPDSTRIHLNSGSRLTYSKHFGQRERQIWLNGEAYFDVTANAQHPFLVHTGRMTIRVLGTAFNVKAYNNTREDEETTVVEGKVEVSLKESEEKKVILLPNEKISLKHNELPSKTADVHAIQYEVSTVRPVANNDDMPREALWMQEKMSFTDEPFEMVALGMERWYNVKIHFENEKIKDMRMNGDFHNISIEEAMKILQMMTPFRYEITGNDIYIR